jgi:hypothetical protein
MKNKELVFGLLIGLILPVIGAYLYLKIFTEYDLFKNYKYLNIFGMLGKVLTLGALLNLASFSYFFYTKKDKIAQGILFATIILTIITFFV